jgi:peroxiredoxin
LELFATYGPADLAQYLVDHYVVGEGALTPPDQRTLALTVEQLRVVNGAPAMDIELVVPGSSDTTMLFELLPGHRYTALFFYSSTCDHCHLQMPGLGQLISETTREKFQVIGIALDADQQEFDQAIRDHGISWPCYSHLMGWGEPAAKDYAVKATPSLFLLGRDGRILGKPMDHTELRTLLEAEP